MTSTSISTNANASKKIPVMEIFGPTVQGEGALTGQVSYFIRTGGCPYRCVWCDQMEAVDPKLIKKHATYMRQEEIIDKAAKILLRDGLPQRIDAWMTLSGGDPLMWNLEKVVVAMISQGLKIAVETQGSFAPEWLQYVDLITCSPKPPSSKMNSKVDHDIIERYHHYYQANIVLKVVIFDKDDLDFAQELKERYNRTLFYLSVGTPTVEDCPNDNALKKAVIKRYQWLADEFLKRPQLWGSVISPQMHTFLYAREKGR